MKALYIGYSKCGTKTMSFVFRTLGYTVYDFPENFGYLGKEWTKILSEGATANYFKQMYKDVDASVDNPVYHFWEEILEAFPDVKLLVMYREEESWLRSMKEQIESASNNKMLQLLYILSSKNRKMLNVIKLFNCQIWGADRNVWPWQSLRGVNYTLMRHRYRRHNLYVQQTILSYLVGRDIAVFTHVWSLARAPKGQLHVVDFKQGWEPICKFLGEPVPDVPFPHENKAGTMVDEIIRKHPLYVEMQKEAMVTGSVLIVFLAIAAFNFFRFLFNTFT